MALELRPDGTLAGFETLEQALEARQRILAQDRAIARTGSQRKARAAKARVEESPLVEPESPATLPTEDGVRFLRALAQANGEREGSDLAKALGMADARGLSFPARAARSVLATKFSAKQVEKILIKQRERGRGAVWRLDVAKVKEAGLLT